jgi:hypothetical protein
MQNHRDPRECQIGQRAAKGPPDVCPSGTDRPITAMVVDVERRGDNQASIGGADNLPGENMADTVISNTFRQRMAFRFLRIMRMISVTGANGA